MARLFFWRPGTNKCNGGSETSYELQKNHSYLVNFLSHFSLILSLLNAVNQLFAYYVKYSLCLPSYSAARGGPTLATPLLVFTSFQKAKNVWAYMTFVYGWYRRSSSNSIRITEYPCVFLVYMPLNYWNLHRPTIIQVSWYTSFRLSSRSAYSMRSTDFFSFLWT